MFKGFVKRSTIINGEVCHRDVLVALNENFDKVASKVLETWACDKWIEGPNGQIYREIEEDHPTDPDLVIIKFARPLQMV